MYHDLVAPLQSKHQYLNILMSEISGIIRQKLSALQENHQIKEELEDAAALKAILAFYQADVSRLQEEVEHANQLNSELKMQEIAGPIKDVESTAVDKNQELQANETFCLLKDNYEKLLTKCRQLEETNRALEETNSTLQEQASAHQNVYSGLQEKINAALAESKQWQEQNAALKREIQSIKEQQQRTQSAENNELRGLLVNQKQKSKDMASSHEAQLQNYKISFMRQMKELLQQEQQQQLQLRTQEKQRLEKELNEERQKLRYVIDTVNEMLRINYEGGLEGNFDTWLTEFKKQAAKYEAEMETFLTERVRDKCTPLTQLARLQKEKIAARRVYLLKTVIDRV